MCYRGQRIQFSIFHSSFFEINDLDNIKINIATCIQLYIIKVTQQIFELDLQVQWRSSCSYYNNFVISNIGNLKIDIEIESVSCIVPVLKKVTQRIINSQGYPSRLRGKFQLLRDPCNGNCWNRHSWSIFHKLIFITSLYLILAYLWCFFDVLFQRTFIWFAKNDCISLVDIYHRHRRMFKFSVSKRRNVCRQNQQLFVLLRRRIQWPVMRDW